MMSFEQRIGNLVGGTGENEASVPLAFEERKAIETRADLRRRGQEFRVRVLNMERPENDSVREVYNRTLALVFREAKGEMALDSGNMPTSGFSEEAKRFSVAAEEKAEIFPRYAAFLHARSAKCAEVAGMDVDSEIVRAGECLDVIRDVDPNTPASLLPDAMILGLWARQAARTPMPEIGNVADAVLADPVLLADYALVLGEGDRSIFLERIPEDRRRAVSVALDASVSRVLHQSIVEKDSEEGKERSKVRLRLHNELRGTVERGEKSDTAIAKILAEAMGSLGEDTRQLLLEILRDEYEGGVSREEKDAEYAPRVMKVFLDHFDDWRGNDVALRVAGAPETDRHLSIYILGKLIKNGYLSTEVKQWWSEEKAVKGKGLASEKARLEIIKHTVSDLGVVPSREILSFLSDDRQWNGMTLDERIGKIRSSQEEFSGVTDNHELAKVLAHDERKAMIFYLLHGGDDRFNLINSYGFGKFKEMLGLIDSLVVHETPMKEFGRALESGGMPPSDAKTVSRNLREGRYPLSDKAHANVEVSFDVSENALVKNANLEIGRVLGREQLGVVMLFPLYREFLEQEGDEAGGSILREMKNVQTLSDRLAFLDQIEAAYPEFRARAIGDLAEHWRAFGEKMILEFPLEQVFGERSVPVRGEELLPRLDTKRWDLKRMKKDVLVILKGGNKQLAILQRKIQDKRRARANLLSGLDRQADELRKEALQEKIRNIEVELRILGNEKAAVGDQKTVDRFAHMNEEEKKEEIEKIGNEILALTEKSPSAIFTYITMQVLGEERLRESDIALVQEIESHLQGPFQAIADAAAYQKSPLDRVEKKRVRVKLEYLDKTARFMNMVRFADSKICCFSSNNYEQVIQHETQNKHWVASISADPLSFVISIESPQGGEESDSSVRRVTPKENLGFIFGSFGSDEEGKPAVLLNGIYYAPGLEGKEQMEAMLAGVERIFSGLPIRTMALAGRYGGSFGEGALPDGYSKDAVRLTRLRALDDGYGDTETKIYDDLATGEDLNRPHWYGGDDVIWHKNIS